MVVEAVGHSATIENAVAACADFGQVILLGSPRSPHNADMTKTFREIHLRWLTVRGALEWRVPPYAGHGIHESIETNLAFLMQAAQAGQLNLDAVMSHVIAPADLLATYRGLLDHKDDYLGAVVDWRAPHD